MLIDFEKKLFKKGNKYIAGVDEVGRGALAGPFVVSAVILDLEKILSYARNNDIIAREYSQIKDSKKLTRNKREKLSEFILSSCVTHSFELINSATLDKIGVSKCTQVGFYNAVRKLKIPPSHIFTDTFAINKFPNRIQTNIKGGDGLSVSIAAASIIAKVFRDNLMRKLHKEYDVYGFDRHKGYGTKFHIEKLKEFGPCKIHRMSFSPLKTARRGG